MLDLTEQEKSLIENFEDVEQVCLTESEKLSLLRNNVGKGGSNISRGEEAFNKLSEEFDGVVVQKKTIEEFRSELVDLIYAAIREENKNSITFMENANYYNVKLSEAKIEGLNKAFGIIIDAPTVSVKE